MEFEADVFREITEKLGDEEIQWLAFENSKTREIIIMQEYLLHTYNPLDIIKDLKSQELKASNATNNLKGKLRKSRQDS